MERGWSQTQLALKLDVHPKQVSGWERAAHTPSTDVLVKIAEVLGVSLDYLAFEGREATRRVDIADVELLGKLEELRQAAGRRQGDGQGGHRQLHLEEPFPAAGDRGGVE